MSINLGIIASGLVPIICIYTHIYNCAKKTNTLALSEPGHLSKKLAKEQKQNYAAIDN